MTSTEKIANAKKRINELERLIEYWNSEKMKAYWSYQLIISFSDYEVTMKKMVFNFFDRYLYNRIKNVPKNKEATEIV